MTGPMDQSLARDTGLFLVLVVLANGLILPGSVSARELAATFYLAFFIHAGFTIYDGRFGSLRTATWLLLIAVWAGPELAAFFGFIFPVGQLIFWLASVIPLLGEVLFGWLRSDHAAMLGGLAVSPVLALLVLGLDIAVMHYDDWRRRPVLQIGIFLAAVGTAAIVLGVTLGAVMDLPVSRGQDAQVSSFPIMPPWYMLPFYALLRAVPDKLGGVTLMFGSMFVLMIWPWMRADLLRAGPARRVWSLLCLTLAADWIGLVYAGSRPPAGAAIHAAQALAIFYFAFFLVLPPVLAKTACKMMP
jgi:ubiquinol-cytochrome c reductase cytochrome b/c1 subunit